MPLDPVLLRDVRGWLQKAKNDLRAAKVDFDAEPPLFEDALFHCQQAAEKTLKALLTLHDRPFRKTHNLEDLGEASLELDETLREIIDEAVPLSEYAWVYRYPGDYEVPDREEVAETMAIARRVFEAILVRIPEAASP